MLNDGLIVPVTAFKLIPPADENVPPLLPEILGLPLVSLVQ